MAGAPAPGYPCRLRPARRRVSCRYCQPGRGRGPPHLRQGRQPVARRPRRRGVPGRRGRGRH
eukprot:2887713-Lingulodinium_polyedra.AAC.1